MEVVVSEIVVCAAKAFVIESSKCVR